MKSNAAGSSFGWFCGIARLTGAGGHSDLPANDKNFCPELLPRLAEAEVLCYSKLR